MTWAIFGRSGNLLPYSEDFTQWLKTTTNTAASEETLYGTTTVTTINDGGTGNALQTYIDTSSFTTDVSSKPRCFSLHVLKDSIPQATRFGAIRLVYTARFADLYFDTSTGEVYKSQSAETFVTVHDYGVEEYPEFWRFYISATATTDFSRLSIFPAYGINILAAGLNVSATGSIRCFGAMLNEGYTPLPYDKTPNLSWLRVN